MEDDKQSREKLIEAAKRASTATPTVANSPGAASTPATKRASLTPAQSQPLQQLNQQTTGSDLRTSVEGGTELSELLSASTPAMRRKSNLILSSAETTQNVSQGQALPPSTIPIANNKSTSVAPSKSMGTPATGGMAGNQSKALMRTPLMVPAPVQSSPAPNTVKSPFSGKRGVISAPASSANSSLISNSSATKQAKKCKIRIQLPDFAGGAIETIVREGQDLMEVSKAIALEHNLSLGYQQKVYDQLRSAFKK